MCVICPQPYLLKHLKNALQVCIPVCSPHSDQNFYVKITPFNYFQDCFGACHFSSKLIRFVIQLLPKFFEIGIGEKPTMLAEPPYLVLLLPLGCSQPMLRPPHARHLLGPEEAWLANLL